MMSGKYSTQFVSIDVLLLFYVSVDHNMTKAEKGVSSFNHCCAGSLVMCNAHLLLKSKGSCRPICNGMVLSIHTLSRPNSFKMTQSLSVLLHYLCS